MFLGYLGCTWRYISFLLISAAHEFIFPQKRHRSSCYNDRKEYGSDIDSDDNTYQYHEIANEFDESSYDCSGHSSKKGGSRQVYTRNSCSSDSKILGGQNVLHSLSNATCLELLADAGEVPPSLPFVYLCVSLAVYSFLFSSTWSKLFLTRICFSYICQ
jgi:hypothetical protein